jgi:hypothetical protein
MSIEYPTNWRELRFPAVRAELIGYLTEIASTSPESNPTYFKFDIDEIVHFFFDDTDLGDVRKFVEGDVLFDDAEKVAIFNLTSSIEPLISPLADADSKAFLSHPAWLTVRQHAAEALRKVRERGVPVIRD